MKNEIVAAVHKVFELGLDCLDQFQGKKAWVSEAVVNKVFCDIPLKIDHYAEGGYCIAYIKVEDITFRTFLKVTELQAHNIKALKGAA